MKKYLIMTIVLISCLQAKAQYNTHTLSGGNAFNNIEDADANGSGFRINGLYEYHGELGSLYMAFQ